MALAWLVVREDDTQAANLPFFGQHMQSIITFFPRREMNDVGKTQLCPYQDPVTITDSKTTVSSSFYLDSLLVKPKGNKIKLGRYRWFSGNPPVKMHHSVSAVTESMKTK